MSMHASVIDGARAIHTAVRDRIRVLIVDDAVVVRRMLAHTLSEEPAIEVVGTAANGRIALAKLADLRPDLVVLDVEMPEMDGLQTLAAIRKQQAALPVIMFSTVTSRGAVATLDALALGASDYVTKPANAGGVTAAMQRVRDELIPRIKALCSLPAPVSPIRRPADESARAARLSWPEPPRVSLAGVLPGVSRHVDVVAIGISTGGPKALATLLPTFPKEFPVPIVIVQHMPPLFTRLLAERLAAISRLAVLEGACGDTLAAGSAWLAPGDYHLVVAREQNAVRIRTHQEPPENFCRPAVDVLFRSVAATYGSGALAVVLTGMGQDGLRGCEQIRACGGQVLVQDQASSVVWGMPGAVAGAGLAEAVLPLEQMGSEILRRVMVGRA
jgi:two-component system chemotaxis response regulator CheB